MDFSRILATNQLDLKRLISLVCNYFNIQTHLKVYDKHFLEYIFIACIVYTMH